MQLSEKDYKDFRQALQEGGIKYETEAEYKEAVDNLVAFAELGFEVAQQEWHRQQRLKDEPKGFSFLGEGRTCSLCSRNIVDDMWYDKWGMRCMNCQEAFRNKIVPGYVFRDRDGKRHITASRLGWKYGLHIQTIKKLVRLGEIVPRQIPNGPMVFLKSENPELPRIISETQQNSPNRS